GGGGSRSESQRNRARCVAGSRRADRNADNLSGNRKGCAGSASATGGGGWKRSVASGGADGHADDRCGHGARRSSPGDAGSWEGRVRTGGRYTDADHAQRRGGRGGRTAPTG